MGIPENIDALLVKYDIGPVTLAKIAGVSESSVSRWRNGGNIRTENLRSIVNYFGLTDDDILSSKAGLAAKEHSYISDMPGAHRAVGAHNVKVPILGRVHAGPAGDPDVFDEDYGETDILASYFENDPEVHVLDYEGDCMNKVFGEGTTSLIVSPNAPFGNGDIVVAVIDNTDYVVRKIEQTAKELRLKPCSWNSEHEDIVVPQGSDKRVDFKGKVLECFKRFE